MLTENHAYGEKMMAQDWDEIFARLAAAGVISKGCLNPPASEDEIDLLQETLGFSLPEEYAACLRVHNGQDAESPPILRGHEFLSSRRTSDEWSTWKEIHENGGFDRMTVQVDPGIQAVWWSPFWIPFTYDGYGNHFCLDMTPAKGGQLGQVIEIWHDDDRRKLRAPSLSDWFLHLMPL